MLRSLFKKIEIVCNIQMFTEESEWKIKHLDCTLDVDLLTVSGIHTKYVDLIDFFVCIIRFTLTVFHPMLCSSSGYLHSVFFNMF